MTVNQALLRFSHSLPQYAQLARKGSASSVVVGMFTHIHGDVYVKRLGEDTVRKAKVGMDVSRGEMVSTVRPEGGPVGSGGAEIRLNDGTRMLVSSNSIVAFVDQGCYKAAVRTRKSSDPDGGGGRCSCPSGS